MPNRIPSYFYDINAVLPDGRIRWFDDPGSPDDRIRRDTTYNLWLSAFRDDIGRRMFRPRLMKWQVVQILTPDHSERGPVDWWPDFVDCLFRVFVEPQTFYSGTLFKQWYILSPEDCYLVLKYKAERDGTTLSPRAYDGAEKYLPAAPSLRKALIVPVECCRHWRHETTSGELPAGL